MLKPTLAEFLMAAKELDNAYVAAHSLGFSELYVRKSYKLINGVRTRTLDIANVVAVKPGKGCFRQLVDKLHPVWNLYVECVLNPDLAVHLQRRGFRPTETRDGAPSYYLLAADTLLP